MACGVPESQIDQPAHQAAQLDSESLWQVVSNQVSPGMRVLFIRGADESGAIAGRDWLAQQLENAQAQVQAVAAYRRVPTQLSPELQMQAAAYVEQGAVWLFSSSAAIESLMSQCPGIDGTKAKAVVTHPRMAQLVQKWGWQQVTIAAPGSPSMLASIKSLA
jgi:uroporphyrinogen-III synthase